MVEMALILSQILLRWDICAGPDPVPVAHLTIRGRDGIMVDLQPHGTA